MPVSVNVPVPDWLIDPVPETVLAKVVAVDSVKLSVPLAVMAEVGVREVKLAASYTTVLVVGIITVATLLSVGIAPPAQLALLDQLPPEAPVYVTEAS